LTSSAQLSTATMIFHTPLTLTLTSVSHMLETTRQ
jgi:hypothetical protein